MKKIVSAILLSCLVAPVFAQEYTRCYPVQKRMIDYYGRDVIYTERVCETVRDPVVIYREVPRAEPRYDSVDIAGAIVFGAIVGAIIHNSTFSHQHGYRR
jgi:uncharacterized protein YcfJ